MFFTLILISSTVLLVLYYWLMKNKRYWEERGVPIIKSSVPYIDNMWPMLIGKKSSGELYHEFYASMPNCSMVGISMCGVKELLLRDPELVKTVLQTNFSSFSENGFKVDPKLDPLLNANPFFNTGEEWKKQRLVLTNNMSTAKLKNMASTISQVCLTFTKYLQQQIEANNGILEAEAQALFARFTGEVVASVGFGVDGKCFTENNGTFVTMGEMMFKTSVFDSLKQLVKVFFPSLSSILQISFIPKKTDQYFRQLVKEVLQAKRNGIHGNDFIQQIYDSQRFGTGEIDEQTVAGHAMSFFVDGYLTSSITLSYVAYEIASHSDVQEKLRREVKQVLQQHDGKVTYDAIQDMKYMDQVVKESMRKRPAVSFLQKICTEKTKLVGSDGLECVLNPGDVIDICPHGMQMDEKYWEDPEVFNPDRFSDEQKISQQKFVYLPFGGGPRVCVGMRMAMLQMKSALAILLDKFSIEVSSKTQLPLALDPVSFLNTVKGGMWLNIKPL